MCAVSEVVPLRAVFIHSPELDDYGYPADCPLVTKRAALTRKTLATMGLLSGSDRAERAPQPATRAELETFHTPRYLDTLRRAEAGDLDVDGLHMGLGTADCPIFKGLTGYASLATGATLAGARLLLAGETRIAFNPSGGYHHAFPERAAGFCYVNDLAIACLELAACGKRVLYLDVDVHHGDGVQYAFYGRSDVMTISLHETGQLIFPGTGSENETGAGEGEGFAVNVPLPPETYDDVYLEAFDAVVMPLARAFDPDVIVLELGLDTLSGDPLAHLALTNNAHVEMLGRVLALERPLLVTGGGGYNVDNTVRGWALAWTVLCGDDEPDGAHLGLGGVMMETTDWHGGLRDRALMPGKKQQMLIEPAVHATIDAVKRNVFPLHGL
jgi:acetoin utilization protein AcuC